jgi:electron transport complex protein RnfG
MTDSVLKHTITTASKLVIFALIFTALMTYVFEITKAPIKKAEEEARMALFRQIVPPNMHDNNLLKDTISIKPNHLLGNKEITLANRAILNNVPAAVILEAIAHDGYNGDIKLLIAIKFDGSISGVRVLTHKETPGLGDYIDITRSDWIKLFNDESLQKTPNHQWAVKKDGGNFDHMAGATITPRAIVKAVQKALQYFATNKTSLFASADIKQKVN